MFFEKRCVVFLQVFNWRKVSLYTAVIVRGIETSAILLNKFKNSVQLLKEYGYGYGNKLVYNSTIEQMKVELGYKNDFVHDVKKKNYKKRIDYFLETIQPLPLSLKYYSKEKSPQEAEVDVDNQNYQEVLVENDKLPFQNNKCSNFPLSITHSYNQDTNLIKNDKRTYENPSSLVDKEIQMKYELLKNTKNWMTAYENFEDDLVETDENQLLAENSTLNYGTSNPNSEISSVPCGGCGALLHCKDSAIPGYVPLEIFENCGKKGGTPLEAIVCQRCYFLKEHNVALEVQVSTEDYPNVLKTIKKQKSLIVVVIDLLDFPCSIWPGLADIFGRQASIFVVGNKIDLLPKDDNLFLSRIKNNLQNNMKLFGFGSLNVLDVVLISAKTGYGVEDLITALYSKWDYKGDIYIAGCTNVGKSTLFNALLKSDFCRVQAKDLLQRATTSLWPGTTLNLLKFPILKPTKYRLYLRSLRTTQMNKVLADEEKLRNEKLKQCNSIEYASLRGHIGETFGKKVILNENNESFSTLDRSRDSGTVMGIDESHSDYIFSKWCYDTPGVVQPDQILNMLTVDELMYVIPRELIKPETFILKPGMTLFIAGLARLDYKNGLHPVRFTVFRSNELPITVCYTEEADKLYSSLLGTVLFKVPINEKDRLSKWPGLELAKTFSIAGVGWKQSSKDIVLSNAGWVAINCANGQIYNFEAWTPKKKGVYIRDCLLPKAVALRGTKIRNSVAYGEHKLI